ncbi:MAG: CDP-alcohol phosphatidyltransferase family protein [Vicinamibacterales bacterium]
MSPRAQLLVAGLVALALVAAGARALTAPLGLDAGFPAFAALVLAVKVGVALNSVDALHPHPRLGPANVVTLARAAMVALLAALVREWPSDLWAWTAIVLGTAAACLDGVDGYLARRSGLASAFGARFDMETDALFILVLSALVWRSGVAGAWILAAGALRYLFVAAGWVLPWMRAPLTPTWRGKTMAVVQMVGLLVALGPIIPAPLGTLGAGLTLAGLTWSFGLDVLRLWRGRFLPAATAR